MLSKEKYRSTTLQDIRRLEREKLSDENTESEKDAIGKSQVICVVLLLANY